MGFDGLFFARLDYQDYSARRQAKALELVWRASQSLGTCEKLLASVNFVIRKLAFGAICNSFLCA